jgi:hypothetical protein
MNRRTLFAGAVMVALSSGAHAVTIEREFDLTASNFEFESILGPDTPAPVDPVELNFTVIFDPSAVIGSTTNGLTINSFSLPNPPYSSGFAYDGAGTLTVATYPGVDNCGNPASSYCVFIDDAAGASPVLSFFEQSTSSGGFWVAQTTTITASAITNVPEPSTWAMMLLGFAGLGYAGFRRRQKLAGAASV